MAKNLVVILGPTASGKTHLAARLAFDLQGEIISADSRQVYKNMDIGTGKDLNQYIINGRKVPYHLIDIVEPENEFNLFEFQKRFYEIFSCLREKKILPILAGGTGLYLESVLCACLHNRTDLEDSGRLIRAIEIEMARRESRDQQKKPEINAVVFGVRWEKSVLRRRITTRLEERLKQGMTEEVMNLHSNGLSWTKIESFGLEYRFISKYLQKKITFEEMKNKLNIAINQFAKRQETWFRRMERKGIMINWIQGDNYSLLKESAKKFLP
jgi:tRNA dimethylallyltransferase